MGPPSHFTLQEWFYAVVVIVAAVGLIWVVF